MTPLKLVGIWLDLEMVLRIDFDNDRHHAVAIDYPYDAECVAKALMWAAHSVFNDPYLKEKVDEQTTGT